MNSGAAKALSLLPVLGGLMASWAGVEVWERWHLYLRRRREAARLLGMSERELRDIGITRADAIREANRSLWRFDDEPRRPFDPATGDRP